MHFNWYQYEQTSQSSSSSIQQFPIIDRSFVRVRVVLRADQLTQNGTHHHRFFITLICRSHCKCATFDVNECRCESRRIITIDTRLRFNRECCNRISYSSFVSIFLELLHTSSICIRSHRIDDQLYDNRSTIQHM